MSATAIGTLSRKLVTSCSRTTMSAKLIGALAGAFSCTACARIANYQMNLRIRQDVVDAVLYGPAI